MGAETGDRKEIKWLTLAFYSERYQRKNAFLLVLSSFFFLSQLLEGGFWVCRTLRIANGLPSAASEAAACIAVYALRTILSAMNSSREWLGCTVEGRVHPQAVGA